MIAYEKLNDILKAGKLNVITGRIPNSDAKAAIAIISLCKGAGQADLANIIDELTRKYPADATIIFKYEYVDSLKKGEFKIVVME